MKKIFILALCFTMLLCSCKTNKENNSKEKDCNFSNEETDKTEETTFYSVNAPSFPIFCYDKTTDTGIKYTSITYKWIELRNDRTSLLIYLEGEKTYGEEGSSKVHYKLKDSDGYIIYSGYCYSDKMKIGDKFKNMCIIVENAIKQDYILELDPK